MVRLRRLAVEPFADGRYVGLASPQALATMFSNSDWKQWQINYSGGPQQTMYKNEAALVHNVRFIDSPNCPRYAVAAHSVCGVFIFGQGAFGFTSLDGMVKMAIKRGPDSGDPFDQFTPITYKIYGAAVALNISAGRILWVHEKL